MSYSYESSASSESDHAEVGGVPVLVILIFGGIGLFMIGLCCCLCYCTKKEGEKYIKQEEQKLANAPTVPPPMDYQNQRKC